MSILQDHTLATEIERIERALRAALDELELQVSMGVRAPQTAQLLRQCKKLVDAHQRTIARLGAGDQEDAIRAAAARLVERLLLLGRDFALHTVH